MTHRGVEPVQARHRATHVITDTDRRGAQVFAMDLAQALSGHQQDVLALAPGRSPNPLPVPVLGPARLHPGTLLRLRHTLASSPVTVAHGSSTLVACATTGLGRSAPFVYRQISDQGFWVRTRLRRARVRAYLRTPAHVVALWQGAADTLIEDFGVDPQRVTVIPNGVPTAQFGPVSADERAAARQRFGIFDDAPVLLSIGALVHEKGTDTAIRAMAELRGHHLLVVGAGPERASLQQLAQDASPGAVTFFAPVQDPAAAYAAADVVVLASRGGDSMPAILIEAGLRGIPAVATPVEGIVDIVRDGVTGRLVAPDDPSALAAAVTEALADPRLGSAARAHCLTRYSIDVVAHQWGELLNDVVSRAAGRR